MPVFSLCKEWCDTGINRVSYSPLKLYEVGIRSTNGDYRILEISAKDEDDLHAQIHAKILSEYKFTENEGPTDE